jgi:uncharacterized protein
MSSANSTSFRDLVLSAEKIEKILGTPSAVVIKKQLTELDHHMINFVATCPFMLLGTYARDGACDVSPRGDLPCVASVLNSKTILIPERLGNKRADSLKNIVETGRVGLLFMRPGTGETLRINGRACVFRDEGLLKMYTVNDKQPLLGIGVVGWKEPCTR